MDADSILQMNDEIGVTGEVPDFIFDPEICINPAIVDDCEWAEVPNPDPVIERVVSLFDEKNAPRSPSSADKIEIVSIFAQGKNRPQDDCSLEATKRAAIALGFVAMCGYDLTPGPLGEPMPGWDGPTALDLDSICASVQSYFAEPIPAQVLKSNVVGIGWVRKSSTIGAACGGQVVYAAEERVAVPHSFDKSGTAMHEIAHEFGAIHYPCDDCWKRYVCKTVHPFHRNHWVHYFPEVSVMNYCMMSYGHVVLDSSNAATVSANVASRLGG